MIKEIFQNRIEIRYEEEDELHHYEITPYSYKPTIAKKISPITYYDLGQGLMDLIYDLELNIGKNKLESSITLRKGKKN